MRNFLLAISTFYTCSLLSQPTIEWQKSLGGSSNDDGYSIRQTQEGGYIVAGTSSSIDGDVTGNHGHHDLWVVKLTTNGIVEWQKCFGGSRVEEFYGNIDQTRDGGYILAGGTASNDGDVQGYHGYVDLWVLKLTRSGSLEWQKSLGGSRSEMAYSVHQTRDDGYIISGHTNSHDGDVIRINGSLDSSEDYWIVKLDSTGNIQWQKTFGGSGNERAFSVRQTSDGGFIVAGDSFSNDGDVQGNHGMDDIFIVKLDESGNIDWRKIYGGSRSDETNCIEQTKDGGYIIGGTSSSNDGDVSGHHGSSDSYDTWIVKLNSNGLIEWQKSIGGSGNERPMSIEKTIDKGFIVAGITTSKDGDVKGYHAQYDCWIVKFNSAGTISWQKCFGGKGSDYATSIQQTSDEGYIFSGKSNSTDGDVTGNRGLYDFWIVKLSPDVSDVSESFPSNNFSLEQNHPNPFSTITTIPLTAQTSGTFEVHDALGRTIHREKISPSQHEIHFNASQLANGVYSYTISDGNRSETKQMVIAK